MTRKIEPWAQDILARSTIAGNVLTLPQQLDRDDYLKVDKVLKALGGKWNRKAGGHVFDFDPKELVNGAATNGTYTSRQQDGQMFWTPEPLAKRMAEMAKILPGERVLEPSAGIGRLVLAALEHKPAFVIAVESDELNCNRLRQLHRPGPGQIVICQADFMAWPETVEDADSFDAVLMNPPFTGQQDIDHIKLAWECLKVGGRLVAIASPSYTFRSDKKAVAFRNWLRERDILAEELPAGTFKESGTEVSARLLWGVKAA